MSGVIAEQPDAANDRADTSNNGTRSHTKLTKHRPRWRGYTAFVLSGGGARGAFQVGALRALFEAGERPDVVVGTSIGAWNGAVIANDPTLQGVETLTRTWLSAHPTRVLLGMDAASNPAQQAWAGMRVLTAARRVAAGFPSLYGDTGMKQFLSSLVGDSTFEELKLPFRVIAADITHGKRVVFSTGPVAPAVLASSAIPGVFPPVHYGDSVYVDGGLLDNCSIETALVLGARRLFILECGYDETGADAALWSGDTMTPSTSNGHKSRNHSVHALAAVLERTAQVVGRYQLERALQQVPRGVEVHTIHLGMQQSGGALEFEKAARWIDIGYDITRSYLRDHPIHARSVVASHA